MPDVSKHHGMAMINISHDIAVIAEIRSRIGVMYAGKLVEFGATEEIFHHPIHPYTQGLLSSFPSIIGPKRELVTLAGEPPDLINPPSGCRFHPRCPFATDVCTEKVPAYEEHRTGHYAACWHPLE